MYTDTHRDTHTIKNKYLKKTKTTKKNAAKYSKIHSLEEHSSINCDEHIHSLLQLFEYLTFQECIM